MATQIELNEDHVTYRQNNEMWQRCTLNTLRIVVQGPGFFICSSTHFRFCGRGLAPVWRHQRHPPPSLRLEGGGGADAVANGGLPLLGLRWLHPVGRRWVVRWVGVGCGGESMDDQ